MNVKNDTVFGWTHSPSTKWFAAVAQCWKPKKGMSAMQVCRHPGIDPAKNYKSVWHLCHRIREAMIEAGVLTGEVEADETYKRRESPAKGNPYVKDGNRSVVVGMVSSAADAFGWYL